MRALPRSDPPIPGDASQAPARKLLTMVFTLWFIIVGLLLVAMAIGRTKIGRLPLSSPMLYLAVGIAFGEQGFDLVSLDPFDDAVLIERVTEIAVIISLFTAGLKLRVPLRDRLWRLPILLAFVSMIVTVGMLSLIHISEPTRRT